MYVLRWPSGLKQHVSVNSEGLVDDIFWTMADKTIAAEDAVQMIKNFFGLE